MGVRKIICLNLLICFRLTKAQTALSFILGREGSGAKRQGLVKNLQILSKCLCFMAFSLKAEVFDEVYKQ